MRVKLEDVCERGSSNLKQSEVIDKTGEYPIFGASGYIGNIDFYHQEKSYVAVVKDGAGIGRTTLHPGKSSVIGTMQYLLPRDNVLPEYLYYVVNYLHLEKYYTGATIPHIYFKDYKNEEFNLDSLENQKVIVDVLGKCESVIESRKRELQLLDELIKARFVELFGNGHDGKTPVKMLGSICKFQQGTQIPVEEQFEEQIAGYKRFLRIIDYTQAPQPPRYVNVNGKEVDEKSVVIVRYGATAGFVGRGYRGILANNLFEIIPDETILSKEFLFLALKYGTFEKEVHEKAFGAAMPALSFSMMNDIPVVVPMSEQQSRFVSFVEQTDKSKVAIQKSLDLYQELFDKLMNDYFGD